MKLRLKRKPRPPSPMQEARTAFYARVAEEIRKRKEATK